jgi:DNA repair protein RadC
MRGRLLARPLALADYEILEMLLFLGIPRRDTKPQAKGLINRFGSLAGTVSAPAAVLRDAGVPGRVVEAFGVVVEAAAALAQAERVERVVLSDWDALDRFLDAPSRSERPPGLSALLLNNRNQLLGECRLDEAGATRMLLRQALERHATAAILVRNLGEAAPAASKVDRALLQQVRDAAAPLAVVVHDMVVVGQGGWISLRPARGRG